MIMFNVNCLLKCNKESILKVHKYFIRAFVAILNLSNWSY
jgi:hypothetical protein